MVKYNSNKEELCNFSVCSMYIKKEKYEINCNKILQFNMSKILSFQNVITIQQWWDIDVTFLHYVLKISCVFITEYLSSLL